jgi:hypothetical protein
MMNGWELLTKQQQAAASVASALVEDAELRFVFMLFAHNGMGAVISNIAPGDAANMIGEAHKAAKAHVEVTDIERERLQ